MAKLDNWKVQQHILEAIRKTGKISMGFKAGGVSEQTLQRYRQTHPLFDNAILEAEMYYHWKYELEYGLEVRRKALDLWNERIEKKKIPSQVLYKFLFERDNRTGS